MLRPGAFSFACFVERRSYCSMLSRCARRSALCQAISKSCLARALELLRVYEAPGLSNCQVSKIFHLGGPRAGMPSYFGGIAFSSLSSPRGTLILLPRGRASAVLTVFSSATALAFAAEPVYQAAIAEIVSLSPPIV